MVRDAYPLLPADARVTTDPPALQLDGAELALDGRVPLAALPPGDDDAGLVRSLLDAGFAYDLEISRDCVRTGQFCDYLYARISRWRTGKSPELWPWRQVIAGGVPLASTSAFIGLQYRLAHRSLLDYLAGSAVLEVDPAVYARCGDPYQQWEQTYGVAPSVLAPVRQHIRDDVEGGHASLFRQVAADAHPDTMPLETAVGALAAARTVFEATRLWQRDMYEHYQLAGRPPVSAGL